MEKNMIKLKNVLKEEEKSMMNFETAFDTYIRGERAMSVKWRDGYSAPYGLIVTFENGYKVASYGGGCSGEDCNTSWIVDKSTNIIATMDSSSR
jgi:hypothetical protein